MNIVRAEWEKRNLGVECIEVSISKNDDPVVVLDVLKDQTAAYQVIKISSDTLLPFDELQGHGFVYAEDQIAVEHDLHVPKRTKIHQRLYDASAFHEMNEADYCTLLQEVEEGMFSTDRIARDPFFGPEVSAKRYKGWLSDLRETGALFYGITYKDEVAGFVVLQTKDNGKTYTSVLGGGYKKYRNSGLGIVQKEYEIVKMLGGKRVYTRVSSNNPGQLKALVLNGWLPINIEHIFVKHR